MRNVGAITTVVTAGCSANRDADDGTPETTQRTENRTKTETDSSRVPFSTGPTIGLEKVAEGLTSPVGFQDPPGDTKRQFIVDQTGQIFVLSNDELRDEPFLDVSDRMVTLGENLPDWAMQDERGLLGLAFHPNYGTNRRFFVRYSAPRRSGTPEEWLHTEILAEFQATDDFQRANPESERVLREFPSPQPIHQAGALAFGSDDYLYIGMGEGGVHRFGQDITENLLGSILRIDVDISESDRAYGIPRDNPLVGKEGLNEHYAWGFRNPWRVSFNDGDLYVADVGSALYEEVNLVTKGANYGWAEKEGTTCIEVEESARKEVECSDKTERDVPIESLEDPVIQYPRKINEEIIGFAVIGGYVYHGSNIPKLEGKYVFGDYSNQYNEASGPLFVADPSDEPLWQIRELQVAGSENGELNRAILSFGRDRDGNLYVCTTKQPPSKGKEFSHQKGEVFKLVPT